MNCDEFLDEHPYLPKTSLQRDLNRTRISGEPIPRGLCRDGGRPDKVAVGEDFGMLVLSGHLGWDGASAPADGILGPEEVPPIGVGLCAARHPCHRYGISGGKG